MGKFPTPPWMDRYEAGTDHREMGTLPDILFGPQTCNSEGSLELLAWNIVLINKPYPYGIAISNCSTGTDISAETAHAPDCGVNWN